MYAFIYSVSIGNSALIVVLLKLLLKLSLVFL